MKILVIGGVSRSLVNFRGHMLQAFAQAGHDVHACAGEPEPWVEQWLKQRGMTFHEAPINRRGLAIHKDWRYKQHLRQLMLALRPDVMLAYTVKPVVYGCLAAHQAGVPRIAAMITGVGAAQPGTALRQRLVSALVQKLYARALQRTDVILFQNPDDQSFFEQRGMTGNARCVQMPGSGVDLQQFTCEPPPTQPVRFLLIARLLAAKGIREYALAASQLKEQYPDIQCHLVGAAEPGSGGIAQHELEQWQASGDIIYHGHLSDVRPALRDASVFVLPSYYGEGQPRTVLEAMAIGRPVITADSPGCRQTVIPEENGLLVPPRDPHALKQAMTRFIVDPDMIGRMGARSRQRAEQIYDVHKVNQIVMRAMGLDTTASPHASDSTFPASVKGDP